ncbi:MAG: Lrp/AsnC family transcriptional regulator [Alphaproteobacteria bacterium]|nr:ArsR family transcriptional regulator [Rhodospirillaceae bacterium]MBL6771774.1 Lrp/AsnC family transcriptional regulator [Alphaproteobacteria bacterium]OUX69929.1 MAG: ArsR family transcriptional regulator [Rhodospirillaceae bacterium TMED140]
MQLDETDQKILRLIQLDATLPLEEIARQIGSTKSPVWNRIKKLKAAGVIDREVAILNAQKIGLTETFFISIRTDQHTSDWLGRFTEIVNEMPEILECHRLTGDVDYIMKVRVASTRDFDLFYKRFIGRINLFNVTSSLSMEVIKETTAIKV